MKKRMFILSLTAILSLTSAQVYADSYTIYPVPHTQSAGTGSITLSKTINIQADEVIDDATLQRAKSVLTEAGYTVTCEGEAKDGVTQLLLSTVTSSGTVAGEIGKDFAPDTNSFLKDGKYDRHALVINEKGIAVLGENTNAVFFGLASLEQILEQVSADGTLTATTIYDWADQQNRGLVEGYYGYPYSVSVKKDLMHYMMRYKMNTYMYGAKSDPYHSQYWQTAYPTSITDEQEKNGWLSQTMVKDIAQTSAETKVNFIWAIHPGNNFVGSSTVVSDIMSKYTKMYELGVRQFAVFVDDVGIPSSDADMKTNADRLTALQKAIEAKWNKEGAAPADTVRPLHFVPQIYCSSFASSDDQRQRFMAALGKTPSYITIYTTGQAVWTVPNSGHMQNMKNELGRSMAWWWNYPCNDNADGQIYTMDMYSNFYDLPSVNSSATMPTDLTNTVGLVANPMQEGEVAKTALFSVADYAWNNAGFNNEKSWEASFSHLISTDEAREAYRFLTRYLRWNEPSSVKSLITAYKSSLTGGTPNSANLRALMTEIIDNCTKVETLSSSDVESDRLLYSDVRPWLLKLKRDCQTICTLLDVAENSRSQNERWLAYLEGLADINDLKTNTDYTAYALEGMGSSISVSQRQAQVSQLYLEPFISYMKENAMKGCFADQTPQGKASYITTLDYKPVVTLTDSTVTIAAATRLYQKGAYVGVQLPQAMMLDSIWVADTLFAKHTILWSSNGKQWNRLAAQDKAPDEAVRYVIVVNDQESPLSFKVVKKQLMLYLPKKTTPKAVTIPTDKEVWQSHVKDYIIDGDYTTFCTLNRCQLSGDAYVVDLGKVQAIHDVRICMGTTNGDYMTEGRVQVSENGTSWKALRVKGVSNSFKYTLDMPQNVKYSDEMTYCDFDGRDLQARYVRLYVSTPNTSKWLRLYEIEVNKAYYNKQMRQLCTDGDQLNATNAIDGNGATCIPTTTAGPLTYYLESLSPAKSVTIYSDPASFGDTKPSISVLNADGSTSDMGQLTEGCQLLDFMTDAVPVAVQIAYENEAPAIYEIVPLYDTEKQYDVLTAISLLHATSDKSVSTASSVIYNLSGQRLIQRPTHGLYIQDGRIRAK